MAGERATETASTLLEEAAAGRPGVTRTEAEGAVVWRFAGTPFAAVRGSTAEFRLRADMVRAGLRTPNTGPSGRGPEWLAFDAPAEPDRYDRDRLTSWFEMAARLAAR